MKKVKIAFAANEANHPRHEAALEKFSSVLDLQRSGNLMLAEMLNIDTDEPEYVMMAFWEEANGDKRVVPFGKLFVDPETNERYAYPDGYGGYNGISDGDEEAETTDDPGTAKSVSG
jgi:hypothetical protein